MRGVGARERGEDLAPLMIATCSGEANARDGVCTSVCTGGRSTYVRMDGGGMWVCVGVSKRTGGLGWPVKPGPSRHGRRAGDEAGLGWVGVAIL
jgi:hypothetical protein